MPGLLCMLRGISFHIYAVLTCTMLHLVSHRYLTLLACTDRSGRHYVSRPRHSRRCKGVLCPAHAYLGNLRSFLPNARDAGTSEQSPPSVLGGHYQALRDEAIIPIWKPSGCFAIQSFKQPWFISVSQPEPGIAIGSTRSGQLPCTPYHSTNFGFRPGCEG
jgi:hypothetical protein